MSITLWVVVAMLLFGVLLSVLVAGADLRCRRIVGKPRARRLVADISSIWIAGYIPRGGGTLGAAVALPVAWQLASFDWMTHLGIVTAVAVVSTAVVHCYVKYAGVSDPPEVVLDELVGCLVVLQFVPWTLGWVAAGFVLFRALDICKPWPIGTIDKRIHGGLGVMLDDVVAGLLAGGLLLSANQLSG